MIYMRWSDGESHLPFAAPDASAIIDALDQFSPHARRSPELAVFVPYADGRAGSFVCPDGRTHIVAGGFRCRGTAAAMEFEPAAASAVLEQAIATVAMWGTGAADATYALRDTLSVRRDDLRRNICMRLDEDLVPQGPSPELRAMAASAGLASDYERAYPA